MKDLELKPSVLERFDLPLVLHRGHVGRLFLQVPWTDLANKPTIVTLEQLFLLVSTRDLGKRDAEAEARLEYARKMQKVFIPVSISDFPLLISYSHHLHLFLEF